MPKEVLRRQMLRAAGTATGLSLIGTVSASQQSDDNGRVIQDLWIRNITKSDKSVQVRVDRQATENSSEQQIFNENIAVDPAGQQAYQRVYKNKGVHKTTAQLPNGDTEQLESNYVAQDPVNRTTMVKINKGGGLTISETHVDLPPAPVLGGE